ncbi:MAG: alpha/beta hydrolase, partial [Thermodesulfobacteriota bacterium]
ELVMPDFNRSTSLYLNKDVTTGVIKKLNLKFIEKNIKQRELKIYLPFNYHNLSDLPCIYVFDGDDMLNFANYQNILDNCIHYKKIEPLVAVFIPSHDRSDEYLNSKKSTFMNVLKTELVPEIERNYKVAKDPEKRALHGISAGGYYALCSIFKHPDMFLKVAAQSSAIKSKLFKIFTDSLKNDGIPKTAKIYMDVGRFDLEVYKYDTPWIFIDINKKFRFELQKYGINHKYRELNDGHSWGNWRERIEDILIYLFSEK